MILTAAFLGLGAILGLALTDRMGWVFAIAYLVRTLVPIQAVGPIFWKFHPSAAIVLGAVCAIAVFKTPHLRRWFEGEWLTVLAVVGLTGYVCLDILGGASLSSDLGVALQILWIPVLYVFGVRASTGRHPRRQLHVVLYTMLAAAVIQVVLGQMQLNEKKAIYWESVYETSWWFTKGQALERGLGTTGHPLQLGLLMATVMPLLLAVRMVWLRLLLIPVFLYGTVVGNARTALALCAVTGLIVLLDSLRRRAGTTIVMTPLIVFAGSAFLDNNSRIVELLTDKLQNDGGSTQLRLEAAQWVQEHYHEFLFLGYQGSRDLRTSGVLRSSVENGYFKAAMTFGTLFAVLYVVFAITMTLRPLLHSRAAFPWFVSAVSILIGFASTSSFMDAAVEGTSLWLVIGGGFLAARVAAEPSVALEDPAPAAHGPVPLEPWRQAARGLTA